jgi:hypothetical protein
MSRSNVRVIFYYSTCLSCGAAAIRSLVATGTVMPCAVCGIGFRLVIGRRDLWDDEAGERMEEFQSALVEVSKKGNFTGHALHSETSDPPTLSEKEMTWLFGYKNPPRT